MKNKITISTVLIFLFCSISSLSQTIKWEDRMNGDNSVAGLQARGWVILNEDGGGTTPPWFQGGDYFSAFEGPDTGYVATDWQGNNENNVVDQWLISPILNINVGDSLSFLFKSPAGALYEDSIFVLISTNSGTTPSDFLQLLGMSVPRDGDWWRYWSISQIAASVRFAIRYYISDTQTKGWYVGLDLFQLFTSSVSQSITVTAPAAGTNWTVGSIYNVNWTSTGVTGNVNIKLSTNGGSTYSISLRDDTPNDGTQNIIVPNNLSTTCRIKVESVNNTSIFGVNPGNFTISTVYPTTFLINKSFGFTNVTSSSSYRMIGLPGQTNFAIPVTGTRKTDWNAFYDNGATSNYLVEFDSSANFNFKPGNGFWLLSKNNIVINTQVNSVPVNGGQTYSIPLHTGWNIISNPFERSTNWSAVQFTNLLDANALIYDWDGSWTNPSLFSPYEAYYFNNVKNQTSLWIPYDPGGTLGKSSAEKEVKISSENDIKLSLLSGGEEKSKVFIGFDSESTIDFDKTDYFAPPGDFEEARIVIRNSKLSTDYKYLMKETRPDIGSGQIYNLEIKNLTGNELILRANGISKYQNYLFYLFDERLGNAIKLSDDLEVRIAANVKDNTYRLLIGTQQFIDANKGNLKPTEFALFQNYPNPFNPTTIIRYSVPTLSNVSIKLYDLLGNELGTLTNEEKAPGNYEVEFGAKDIASGVYIYKLQAGSFTQSKKMILLR